MTDQKFLIEFRFQGDVDDVELLEELLIRLAVHGSNRDLSAFGCKNTLRVFIEQYPFQNVHVLISSFGNSVCATWCICDVVADDWIVPVSTRFPPNQFSDQFLIISPGAEVISETSRPLLMINAGSAFGTERYETTRIVLNMLCNMDLMCTEVFDLGVGSGILSFAAVLMGVRYSVAVDSDYLSTNSATDYLLLINMLQSILIIHAYICQVPIFNKFTCVITNIKYLFINNALPEITRLMSINGSLFVSGIIAIEFFDYFYEALRVGLKSIAVYKSGVWYFVYLENDRERV